MEAMKKLLVFLRPMRWRMATAVVTALVVAAIWTFWPLLYSRVVDKAIPSVPGQQPDFLYFTRGIPFLIIALFLVPLFHYVIWCFLTITIARLGQRFVFDLRYKFYRRLMGLSLRFYAENTTGKIVQRLMDDVGIIQKLLGPQMIQLVVDVVYLIGGISMMAYLNYRMLLIPLFFVPVYFFNYNYFRESLRKYNVRYREYADFFMGYATERLGGVELVKSFGREEEEYHSFIEQQNEDADRILKARQESFRFSAVCSLITGLGNAAVYLIGCAFVLKGGMKIGEAIAYCAYASWIFNPIVRLSQLSGQVQVARVSVERVFEYMDIEPEVVDSPDAITMPPITGEVRFEEVCFSYDVDKPILEEINLAVPAGTIVALVGHTGCGKTTLVNLLLRFYDVSAGRITIDGHDIRDVRVSSLLRQVGVVPQDPVLFSVTLRENIAYGRPKAPLGEIIEAARKAEIHDFIHGLPKGYESRIGPEGLKFSTGQKQQVAIARAILSSPAILVLDEATASLDSQSEALIQKALAEAMRGKTCFVVAHRLSTIVKADMIVAMDEGKIVEVGRHEELVTKEGGLYQRLYERQVARTMAASRITW